MDTSVIFELKEISKFYGKRKETMVKALDEVSLTVHRGEFTVIMGPSGSGKTTLLNIMCGLDHPCSGSVVLGDEDLSSLSGEELSVIRRDHIGIIFQAYNLISVLTVEENIEYIMVLQNIPKADRKKRVADLLVTIGLEGKAKRFPKELSGGQQQRVAVARALSANPDIIIADEPTANLDSESARDLLDMMEQINREFDTTFVFSTHDPRIMERARRLVVLEDGKVMSDEVRS